MKNGVEERNDAYSLVSGDVGAIKPLLSELKGTDTVAIEFPSGGSILGGRILDDEGSKYEGCGSGGASDGIKDIAGPFGGTGGTGKGFEFEFGCGL